MLKHMLNGTASAVGAERNANAVLRDSSSSSSPPTGVGAARISLSTALQQPQHRQSAPQPQQPRHAAQRSSSSPPPPPPILSPSLTQRRLQRSLESVDDDSDGRLGRALVSEPEYQNTRRRSSPETEFYGGTPLGQSVRSAENVTAVCDAESRIRRTPLEPPWMRAGGDGRFVALDAAPHSRLDGRGSGPNYSFASGASSHSPMTAAQHRLQQGQQQQPPPSSKLNRGADAAHNSSAVVAASRAAFTPIAQVATKPMANGGLRLPKRSPIASASPTELVVAVGQPSAAKADCATMDADDEAPAVLASDEGVREVLASLGLLCLVSSLLALLSLIFLLKISPVAAADAKESMRAEQLAIISPDEYVAVYEVTLALCSLTLSLNLCCLLVCSVQFLFAVKLSRSSLDSDGTNKYLQKSAATRVCAIAGFFISIPVFLTGVILYTFVQFHSTSAIVTSALVGSGIVFCGCAMVHNVFVWQKEKTNAVKALVRRRRLRRRAETKDGPEAAATAAERQTNAVAVSPASTLCHRAAVDVGSIASSPHELSTLV